MTPEQNEIFEFFLRSDNIGRGGGSLPSEERITEDEVTRVTEDDDIRVTE